MWFQDKNKLIVFYFILYVLALLKIFFKSFWLGYPKDSIVISEFLINYQGGFVRRGLLGELILFLYRNFKISPYTFIIALSTISLLILIIYFIVTFRKAGYSLFILPFGFFLGNPIINEFWVRKDILLILFFLLIIHLLFKKKFLTLLLINIILITGVLIHEEIGFISFPILFLLQYHKSRLLNTSKGVIQLILRTVIQLSPSFFAFLLVLYFKGSATISTAIWQSWKNIPFKYESTDEQTVPRVIAALSRSLKEGLSSSQRTFLNFDNGVHSFLGWGLIITVIYYLLSNLHLLNFQLFSKQKLKNVSINKSVLTGFLIIQFIAVLPLFILGYDYSRWIFLWVSSSFILLFTVPKEIAQTVTLSFISNTRNKIDFFLDSALSKSVSFLFLLTIIIGFPSADWRLFACLQNSSLVIVLKLISTPFYILFHVILK